jgi:hypothetical protein
MHTTQAKKGPTRTVADNAARLRLWDACCIFTPDLSVSHSFAHNQRIENMMQKEEKGAEVMITTVASREFFLFCVSPDVCCVSFCIGGLWHDE